MSEKTPETPTPELRYDQRGFRIYGEFPDHNLVGVYVKESSLAEGPHCRIYLDQGSSVHLSLAQAMRLRAMLDAFIQETPERWANGARFVEEAEAELRSEVQTDGIL